MEGDIQGRESPERYDNYPEIKFPLFLIFHHSAKFAYCNYPIAPITATAVESSRCKSVRYQPNKTINGNSTSCHATSAICTCACCLNRLEIFFSSEPDRKVTNSIPFASLTV